LGKGATGCAGPSPDGADEARQGVKKVKYSPVLSRAFTKGMTPMDKAQVDALASKHAALHAMIDEEEHRTHPDEDLLHRLKKEKLRLKDELAGHIPH
jgi:uncharacterized protein YdcH (DUF465 family)